MRRRTGDETRALLLKAGVQMLLERGASAGVQHIRLQEVLRRVGLTTGAAYRLWADQTDYQRDLAVEVVRLRLNEPDERANGAVAELLTSGGSLDDVIRAAALTHVQSIERLQSEPTSPQSQSFLIALALRATADTWPELIEASRARHEESIEVFNGFYSRVMDAFGYRMRTPYSIRDFTEAMAALGEGFAIHSVERIPHPPLVIGEGDEGPPGEWTLFGLAVRGLVGEFMVKRDAPPGAEAGRGVDVENVEDLES